MRRTINKNTKQSWVDLLAKEKSYIYNGGGVASTTLLPPKANVGRDVDKNDLTEPKSRCLWFVMWVTRGRKDTATTYFKEQDITCWVPEVTRKEKVNGKVVERQENLLSNKLFILIEPSHLQLLRDQDRNNPFLAYVRDRTKEKVGNDYPPMIIPDGEMRNFQRFISAHDDHMVEVTDSSKLTRKDENNTYVVVEGKHAGLRGKRARYKKHDRIIVKCGTWVFATGYIQASFLKVLETNADDSNATSQNETNVRLPFAERISDVDFDKLLADVGATSHNIAFDSDKTLTAAQVEKWLTMRFPKQQESQWFVLKAKDRHPVSSCFYLQEKGIPTFLPLHKKAMEKDGHNVYQWAPLSDEYIYAYTSLDEVSVAIQGSSLTFLYHTDASHAPNCSPEFCVNDDKMRRFILSACLANGFIYPLDNNDVEYVSADLVELTAGQYKGVVGRMFRDNDKLKVAIDNGVQKIATGHVNAKDRQVVFNN